MDEGRRLRNSEFLSTPSARRATPPEFVLLVFIVFLSTPSARRATLISLMGLWAIKQFLSTPSARRATAVAPANVLAETYFYPRPPRGGRPCAGSAGGRP